MKNMGNYLTKLKSKNDAQLQKAAKSCEPQYCKWWIEKGANVNCRDFNGTTPLFWPSMKGDIDTAEVLCDYDADVEISDKTGQTPIYWAVRNGHYELAKMLLDRLPNEEKTCFNNVSGIEESIFSKPCEDGNLEMVDLLLRKGKETYIKASLNTKDRRGKTPLNHASGYRDIVMKLCDYGADIELSESDGLSMLYKPCRDDDKEMVKYLIKKGANPSGDDCLNIALELYNDEIVTTLVENGSDVNKV